MVVWLPGWILKHIFTKSSGPWPSLRPQLFIHWDKWLESLEMLQSYFRSASPRHGTCNLPFRKKFLLFLFPQTLLFIFFWQAKVALFAKKKLSGSIPTVFSTMLTKRKSANQRGAPEFREFYAKIPRLRLSLLALWRGESWLFMVYSNPLCQIRQDFPWFTCSVLFFMIFWFNPPICTVCLLIFCLRNVPWIV